MALIEHFPELIIDDQCSFSIVFAINTDEKWK